MRARKLIGLGTLALLAGACECTVPPSPPVRGVVLIVVDTLRADALGLYGYEKPTSPFLDRFAAERGVVFDQARSTAPWTKPSVASILTGLDPRHHQVTGIPEKLHSSLLRLPEAFRAAGWQTAGVQSNFLLRSIYGFGQGFDAYEDGIGATIASHDTSTGKAVNEAALHWLREQRDPARPFFLYVHHYEPHFRYLLDGAAFEDEPGSYDGPLDGSEGMDELVAATALLQPADVAFLRARYDAEVRYQDELIEELVAGIDALGLGGETLIAFTADHGEEFLEHGDLSHQYKMFDELLHVPLVLARPGERAAGRRIAADVSLRDLGRTLLDLCGLPDADFPGRSFAPLLDGAGTTGEERDVLAHARTTPNTAEGPAAESMERDMILRGSWKLTRNLADGSRSLFDLANDPGETNDLWAPDRPEALELEARLQSWLEATRPLERELEREYPEYTPEDQAFIEAELARIGYAGG